ncbi:hypothetical protein D4764_0222240, partial [Takifugu flavidus]
MKVSVVGLTCCPFKREAAAPGPYRTAGAGVVLALVPPLLSLTLHQVYLGLNLYHWLAAANFLTEEKKDIVADYVRWYVIDRNSSVIDRRRGCSVCERRFCYERLYQDPKAGRTQWRGRFVTLALRVRREVQMS